MPQIKIFKGIVVLLLLLSYSCKKDELGITKVTYPSNVVTGPYEDFNFLKFDNSPCIVDIKSSTIFFPISNGQALSSFSAFVQYDSFEKYNLEIDGEVVINNEVHNFGDIDPKKPLSLKYKKNGKISNYKLLFTPLPIIEIHSIGEIEDDPKKPCRLKIHDPNFQKNNTEKQCMEFTAGIETRGSFSQHYEKKSLGIEFWKSHDDHTSVDASPFNLRNDDDWILNAMYIDGTKMRNKISTEIWSEMNDLYYQDREPKAKNYVRGEYVEVFLNGRYHGLYQFMERMDRKQLQLKENNNAEDGGFLYKTLNWQAPAFESYVDFSNNSCLWHGFEQKFPSHHNTISWDFLYNGVKLVVDGDSRELNDQIDTYFEIDNIVDCFILFNVIYGYDNTGKNMYYAKYSKNEPLLIVPWDMDASWGGAHDGEVNLPFDKMATNNLYKTLIKLNGGKFLDKLLTRWSTLRNTIITPQKLTDRFRKYEQILEQSGAIEREAERWDAPFTNFETQIDLVEKWIKNRIDFLDYYFYDVHEKRELN